MIAQSVGAVLVATWVHDYAPAIRGLVLASPAFKVKLYVPLARPALALWHRLRGLFFINSYVKGRYLTHDRQRVASFNNDPLITRAIAVNILLDLYKTSERIIRDAAAITLPTQLLISGDDYVVHRQPQIDFYQRLRSPLKELHLLPGFYHDTLGEENRAQAFEKMQSFIRRLYANKSQKFDYQHEDRTGPSADRWRLLSGGPVPFSFSAGAIDYALMYNLPAASQNVWMLLVMGVVFFAIYFVVFSLVIRMFNLKTPGREDKEDEIVTEEANSNTEEGLNQLATNYIAAVGGTDNLKAIDACITRLRLTVADSARVNDTMCKRLGASGVVKLNKQTIQVIVGAKAESIGDAMKKVVARGPVAAASAEATPATAAPVAKPQAVPNAVSIAELVSPITGDVVALDQVPDEAFASKAVGDGVAVKPTDKIVVSPAAGTIVKIFNTNHAFCLETEKGAEIVVHMGIDTVALEGKGFKRLVEEGAQVSAGQPILEMDLDYLNANARSMISPVVCSNIDDFSGLIIKAQGHVVAGQTPLYEIKK